jgi:hypothetical protein
VPVDIDQRFRGFAVHHCGEALREIAVAAIRQVLRGVNVVSRDFASALGAMGCGRFFSATEPFELKRFHRQLRAEYGAGRFPSKAQISHS